MCRAATGVTATAAGGAGIVATSVPFVASIAPQRASALGAAVEVDLEAIKLGELLTVEWRGKPVWVLHRTAQMIEALRAHDELLSDPRSRTCPRPAIWKCRLKGLPELQGATICTGNEITP